MRSIRASLLVGSLVFLVAPGVFADPRVVVSAAPHDEARGHASAIKEMFGVPVAVRLTQSDDAAARLRGIERLASIGTPEAVDAIVEQIEQGSPAARDPRARLAAVRALAGSTKKDNVRQLLLRETTDASSAEGRGSFTALGTLIRGTAALALARDGEKKALQSLVAVVLQGGPGAEASARALRAYPPQSLESFLESRKVLPPALATLLGELGDLRVVERLRAMLHDPDPAAQTAAAIALARLRDEAALPIAREWLTKSEPRLRRAAAEVLTYLGAPQAPAAVAALFASDATREDGLRLALRTPSPDLAGALVEQLGAFAEGSRPRAIAALGRAGGPKAIAALTAMIDKPADATAAAHALALIPDVAAREAIDAGLASAKSDRRRLWIRAAIVRALALGDAPTRLRDALVSANQSKDPADRALGAFGRVATGEEPAEAAILAACPADRCDPAALSGVARGALAGRARDLAAFLPLLTREAATDGPSPIATIAAVALLARPDGGDLSTLTLAAWAEAGGPAAPLAARALPTRDHEAIRGRIRALLEGSDPVVRAHTALGLGRDPEASAVSLLTSAYRFEDDASVRRAIVRALSRRSEVQRTATLITARDLDPDDEVRALARSAIDGRDLDPAAQAGSSIEAARRIAWIVVTPNDGQPLSAARSARLTRSDGLAIPVVTDPDGVLLIPGLPPGVGSLQLTPEGPPAR
ncbi:MAG: HEAT repeat domain-containing protein [Byssovorax sp.]